MTETLAELGNARAGEGGVGQVGEVLGGASTASPVRPSRTSKRTRTCAAIASSRLSGSVRMSLARKWATAAST